MVKAAMRFGESHPRFVPQRRENWIFSTRLRASEICKLRRGIDSRRSKAADTENIVFGLTISGASSLGGTLQMPTKSKLLTTTKE